MRFDSEKLTYVIKELVKKWGEHPYDINNGGCDQFAMEVQEKLPQVEVFWGDELPDMFPDTFDSSAHCFIKLNDRYYDAEEPCGVLHPMKLPLFFRHSTKDDAKFTHEYLLKAYPDVVKKKVIKGHKPRKYCLTFY